jgi:hypothetical protein
MQIPDEILLAALAIAWEYKSVAEMRANESAECIDVQLERLRKEAYDV